MQHRLGIGCAHAGTATCPTLIPCAAGSQSAPVVMGPLHTSVVHAPEVTDIGWLLSNEDQRTIAL